MSRKVLSGVVAVLLLCAPMGLAAQEREGRAPAQASVLENLWSGLATWFGIQLNSNVDGRCAVDPDGCPSGTVAPPEPPPASWVEGSCAIDPDGCPGS